MQRSVVFSKFTYISLRICSGIFVAIFLYILSKIVNEENSLDFMNLTRFMDLHRLSLNSTELVKSAAAWMNDR